MSFVSNILGAAKGDFSGSVANVVNDLGRGDLQGAVDTLAGTPERLIAGLGAQRGVPYGDGFRGIHKLRDIVQDWCWYCVLPEINGTTLPWYYVGSANTPFRNLVVETLKRNGHSVHFVESYELNALTLKFVVDGSSKSSQYIKSWQAQILQDRDPSQAVNQGIWGMPAAYKKTITLVVMSVSRKELLTFKYYGCFPSTPQPLELGAGSSTPLELTVEFQVDDLQITARNDLGLLENISDSLQGLAIGALTGAANSALQSFTSVPTSLE